MALPSSAAFRPRPHLAEPPAKRFHGAGPVGSATNLFAASGSREAYMMQHVHRRLHAQAAALSDERLLALGKLSFSDQFPFFERPEPQPGVPDVFGGVGRQAYMASRIHRRLHGQVATFSDEQLLELGHRSFNEQFPLVNDIIARNAQAGATVSLGSALDPFGGVGREGYMQQRVHRRLHVQASTLNDEQLLALGKLSFNDQFPALEQLAQRMASAARSAAAAGHAAAGSDLFPGGSRETYIQTRIHRKLHTRISAMGDMELLELGKLTFNDQFQELDRMMENIARETGDVFGGLGREAYMQQRIHRKLHLQAATLSDEELLELGKRSFNEQFPYFEERPTGVPRPTQHPSLGLSSAATAAGQEPAAREQGVDFGQGLSRDEYMRLRVHRRLHAQAVDLSDQDLLDLGKLSFNKQFEVLDPSFLEPAAQAASSVAAAEFSDGLTREEFVLQRVHSDLHTAAQELTDDQLLELGRHGFDAQTFVLSQMAPHLVPAMNGSQQLPTPRPTQRHPSRRACAPTEVLESAQDVGADVFGGRGREGYMELRVHRKLHGPAAALTDQELVELGSMSFNDQFPAIGQMLLAGDDDQQLEQSLKTDPDAVNLFKGMDRETFLIARVHKRLHAQVMHLSDRKLDAIGKMSFNDQFLVMERAGLVEPGHHPPQNGGGHASAQPGVDFGPGVTREMYLQTRVHRKLHLHAAELSDEELLLLGQLKFNDQFTHFETHQVTADPAVDLDGPFEGLTREQFMAQRIHRRLHQRAASLSDLELYDIAQLPFNQQFPALGEAV